MSFLPEIENGALKKEKTAFKRRAHAKKKVGYLPKGQRKKDGRKLWREWHEATDWIIHIA